jgi:hypothetical protein
MSRRLRPSVWDPASLSSDPVNLIRVTVTRSVQAGIVRVLGAASTTSVRAAAVAAVVSVEDADADRHHSPNNGEFAFDERYHQHHHMRRTI